MEQGKRYRVTGWHSLNPRQVMTVWTDTVTETEVRGHISTGNYNIISASTWDRELADSWVWCEVITAGEKLDR